MKTLIITDESVNLASLDRALRSRHHELFLLNRATVEENLSHPLYSLIFIALSNPLEQGLPLCRFLKHKFSSSTIILCVEEINNEILQEFLGVGIHDYLNLPLSDQELNLRLSVIEKQIEENIARNTKARTANGFRTAALQQFPYIVSHHLRQTLIQIKKQLNELLIQPREIPFDIETKAYLGQLLERTRLMHQLISEVLIDHNQNLKQGISESPISHQDYLLVDRNFIIQEHSDGINRYAEQDIVIFKGEDVRTSFPELTGSEETLTKVIQAEINNFGIPGIARVAERNSPLYFDIYVTKYMGDFLENPYLIILLNDATDRMIFQQKLVQSANEAELLLRRLRGINDYIDKIINSMADALIVTTQAGIIKKVNRATKELFGYSERELLDRPLTKLLCDGELLSQVKDINVKPRVEIACLRKTGEKIAVAFSCGSIQTVDDRPEYVYVGRDITEQKKAEARIRKLYASLQEKTIELQNVNEELESFSRTVSHDLRTPISHIEFFNQMLLEEYGDKLDEEGKDYIQQIEKSCQRMKRLIEDLLQLSRITKSDLPLTEVNLSQMAKNVLDSLRVNMPHRQAEFNICPDLIVQANEPLLHIVLDNLLGNAWKYTSKREVTKIELGVSIPPLLNSEKSNSREPFVYYIRDNGAGFNMDHAAKLFRAFERLHSPTEFEGTGIGLTTVQRIIQRHGGKIWAEGEVNLGSTFYFTLNSDSVIETSD
ncbi:MULTISPECIES: histidine kinase dimerization/phospho-acceptor domain-containing protein [Spirulina sp. CCY15215]|uniref:histidine kinase dimerization/phospho-acceptor domain-containing protein n=1 Tax=Spirulina sp. CCY15215 TaxID=2767591 RepID=UPI001951DBE0|nr:histidine kinase dimerization/phospho-acceptor domain-containing protein [Spirulina major]